MISDRLGHASIQVTMDTYSHVMPGMEDQVAREVESIFANPLLIHRPENGRKGREDDSPLDAVNPRHC